MPISNAVAPKIHPDIEAMRASGTFRFNPIYVLALQKYQPKIEKNKKIRLKNNITNEHKQDPSFGPNYFRTKKWVERIKNAIAAGVFEVTGELQSIPDGLASLSPHTEVVLRFAHSDNLVTAEVALLSIKSIATRQSNGRFEMHEVAAILAKVSGGSEDSLSKEAYSAFNNGKLRFYYEGSPVSPTDRILLLGYGEYTTPLDVNRWLEDWGAQYRFPTTLATEITAIDTKKLPNPKSTIINRVSNRSHPLASLIEKAQKQVSDPFNANDVFWELKKMAANKIDPLFGFTADGIQWTNANDQIKYYKLKNLRDYLSRRQNKSTD